MLLLAETVLTRSQNSRGYKTRSGRIRRCYSTNFWSVALFRIESLFHQTLVFWNESVGCFSFSQIESISQPRSRRRDRASSRPSLMPRSLARGFFVHGGQISIPVLDRVLPTRPDLKPAKRVGLRGNYGRGPARVARTGARGIAQPERPIRRGKQQ
jgi:hypothetical protein